MEDKKKPDGDKVWKIFVTAFSLIGTALGILACSITIFSLLG